MLIFTNSNTVVSCIVKLTYAMVYIMTIVVVDRWYAYYCGRCYCQFWNNIVADGKLLRQILYLIAK